MEMIEMTEEMIKAVWKAARIRRKDLWFEDFEVAMENFAKCKQLQPPLSSCDFVEVDGHFEVRLRTEHKKKVKTDIRYLKHDNQ